VLSGKLKINKYFYHLLNEIYKNSNCNKEFFFYKTKLNFDSILSKFVDIGYIIYFVKYSNFYYVKLKTNANTNNKFVNVKNSFKIKNKNKTILLKELIMFNKKHGSVHNYLVNTDKGIIIGYSAINKRVGGKLLLSLL
jgi:ribosomal protein S8